MSTQWNREPERVESLRQGFKDAESSVDTADVAKTQPSKTNPSNTSPPSNASESESQTSADVSRQETTPAVPPLGTAHSAQRVPGEVEAERPSLPQDEIGLADSQSPEQHEQALMKVVAELEALGELDPQTKQQLIADLRETKPALWQPMLGIYRLAVANRKRADAQAALPAAATGSEVSLAAATALPAPERLPQRPSPLRLSQGEANLDRSFVQKSSDSEVRPTSYETADTEFVADVPVPRQRQDRTVRLASAAEPQPAARTSVVSRHEDIADWQAYLEESILLLEEGIPGPARTAEEIRRQAELRLLYLAGGDREAALRPIDGISTTQQEFWSETLFGLASYLDAEAMPDGPRRAAEARRHLEAAITRLGELSTLSVRNITFCSKVNSYGIYETYAEDDFEPGQQVLLYAELENFKCEETPEGFVTAVRSSYQIFDARGVRVESHDFAVTEETCRNRRRDFFMRYFVDLPTRIYDGEYTLKITIEDMKGQTSGEASIPFTIKEHKPRAASGSASRSGPGGL